MATIYQSLSKRVCATTGMAEIIIRLRNGKDYDLLAKSEIFVTADNFRNGGIVVNRRKVGNDVKYHEEQAQKMDALCTYILNLVQTTDKSAINTKWFKLVVDKYNHPEKYTKKVEAKKTFYELAEEYLTKKDFSYDHTKAIRVLVRDVARYEGFRKATEDKKFSFDVDKITRSDIEDFLDYLRNEKELSEEYPVIFKKLLKQYPIGVKKGQTKLVTRGDNTIVKLTKKTESVLCVAL